MPNVLSWSAMSTLFFPVPPEGSVSQGPLRFRAKHVALSALLVAANVVVFASKAEAREEGPKSCYVNSSHTCICTSPHAFPTCSSAAECQEIFPDACRSVMT